MVVGYDGERAGIRLISAAGDYSIDYHSIERLEEIWSKDYQVNKYLDGHNRIYLRSAWRKVWALTFHADDVVKTFISALRSETGDIKFFPLWKYDKATYYKVRVDTRAPLHYYAGLGDAEKQLKLILYEIA